VDVLFQGSIGERGLTGSAASRPRDRARWTTAGLLGARFRGAAGPAATRCAPGRTSIASSCAASRRSAIAPTVLPTATVAPVASAARGEVEIGGAAGRAPVVARLGRRRVWIAHGRRHRLPPPRLFSARAQTGVLSPRRPAARKARRRRGHCRRARRRRRRGGGSRWRLPWRDPYPAVTEPRTPGRSPSGAPISTSASRGGRGLERPWQSGVPSGNRERRDAAQLDCDSTSARRARVTPPARRAPRKRAPSSPLWSTSRDRGVGSPPRPGRAALTIEPWKRTSTPLSPAIRPAAAEAGRAAHESALARVKS